MDGLTPDQVVRILERGTTVPGDGWDSEQIGDAPECGQKLNYGDAKQIERISFRFRSPENSIFDNIEAAVQHFMCPGLCSMFCPLYGDEKTVLPNGHNCDMCDPEYYQLHPLLVAEAMGYEIIPSDKESTQ